MSKLVTVYSPDGAPEKHTLANARDLINGAKYTWKPGVEADIRDLTPAFAVPTPQEKLRLNAKPASQEIFDRYGTTAEPQDDPLPEAAPEETVEETPTEEVVETSAEEATLTELPRAKPSVSGRGRPSLKN